MKYEAVEGGVASQQSGVTDAQWEIFKLAFQTSGRIAVLTDKTMKAGCMTTAFWKPFDKTQPVPGLRTSNE